MAFLVFVDLETEGQADLLGNALATPLIGHAKDSLWSLDLFRCESAMLRTYWVLAVMDQFSRRMVGFAVHRGVVDGVASCRMNQNLVSQQHGLDHDGTEPTGSSKSDHDDDGMQKKNQNVAHAQDGIKLGKLKNSGPLAEFATHMTTAPMPISRNCRNTSIDSVFIRLNSAFSLSETLASRLPFGLSLC